MGRRAEAQAQGIARRARAAVCHGPEVAPAADGSQYFGQAAGGAAEGYGAIFYADGTRYVGQWRGGQPQGQGVALAASGSRYVGGFDNGKRHGKGVAQTLWQVDLKLADRN